MIRACILFILLFLCACDLDVPFNQIPCHYSLEKVHDTLKVYNLSLWGERPKGFKSKEVYSLSDLDTSTWDIFLAIDSPNYLFFSGSFVAMLARKVFDDSANRYFQQISFQLKQSITPVISGSPCTVELTYNIDRNSDITSLSNIPTVTHPQIPTKIGDGYGDAGYGRRWRVVELEIDSVPANAYQIAKEYRQAHQEYQDITIYVKHVSSKLCQSVKYGFWFE